MEQRKRKSIKLIEMRKSKKDFKKRIYEYINNELDKEEKAEFDRLINENEELKRYYYSVKKFYNALRDTEEKRIPYSVEYRVLSKILSERKRKLSLSFGFVLTALITLLMVIPFPNNNIKENVPVLSTYKNHKFVPSNYVSLKHVKEIGITVYIKDEKIEEKSGRLCIPKNEFTPLYETLKDKGEVEIDYISGGEEEQDIITVKINYKNYPTLNGTRLVGFYLPYILMALLFFSPIFFFIKRKT